MTFPFRLRDYQQKVISELYALIRQGSKKILIMAPTGAGKTIVITKVIHNAVERQRKVLFVVHREVLVKQTYEKFASVGLRCGFFKAGWEEDLDASIQIASVQTLPNRKDWRQLNFDVIVFDECHLVAYSKICIQMMSSIFPKAIYIGLTATPWRLSKRQALGDIYEDLVCAPMPRDLIQAGFLVKPSYYGLDFVADLDDIQISGGDYNINQLSNVCDRPELIEQLCESWFELAYDRPTIVFAVGVNHAKSIVSAFKNHGISAAVVSGETPTATRNELYKKLAEGDLKVVASCNALSEGFDVPVVSCVILARPTKSKALYFQQLGRGLRLAENKRDCLVLDQSRNVMVHGFVEDLKEVTLNTSDEGDKEKGKAPLKICPSDDGGCGAYIYAIYQKCPHCKYDFDVRKLVKILGRTQLLSAEDKTRISVYRSKLREAYQNSYSPTWAAVKFKDQFGFFPPYDWARGAIFENRNSAKEYKRHLKEIASRSDKDKDWVEKYLCLEFGAKVQC